MAEHRTDIVIRPASASDATALRRLAALDDAPAPHAGEAVLIAEEHGTIVAALYGNRAVADPFRPTAALVELLRLRAGQLASAAAPRSSSAPGLLARLRDHAPVAPRSLPQG